MGKWRATSAHPDKATSDDGSRRLKQQPLGLYICLDTPEAMKFDWQRLHTEYARQFGMEAPNWPPQKERTN